MATVVDERALDERLAQLEAARAWSPRVISRLETLIREGDDAARRCQVQLARGAARQ